MEWGAKAVAAILARKENIVDVLLIGAFAALGARSVSQQYEIDALEAEKQSLRDSNKAMQKSMWDWRQSLHNLHESDPSNSPISLSRLRTIYGEEEPDLETDVATSLYGPPIPVMTKQQQQQGLEAGGGNGKERPTSTSTFAV